MRRIAYLSLVLLMMLVLLVPMVSTQEQHGPKIDVLRYKVIKYPDAQIEALQTCQADVLSGLVRATDIEKLESEGFTITSTYGFHIFFVGFNVRPGQSPPLDDVNFRHALAHSFNKIGILWSLGGYIKTPVNNMVPPSLGGWHNPNVDSHPFKLGSPFDIASLTADASAGQPIVNVTDASIFKQGDSVWIADETAEDNWELNEVAEVNIVKNMLTMENNLTNTYAVAANGVVAIHGHSTCSILREARYTFIDADSSGTVTDPDYWLMSNGEPLPTIRMLTPPLEVAPQSYGIIQAWIQDASLIGLTATTENGFSGLMHEPFMDYFYKVFIEQDFDGFVIAWLLDRFPDYLYDWFHSSQDFPGGYNAYGVHDPELDLLLETIKFGINHDEKVVACHAAQERLANGTQTWGIPTIPVYSRHFFDAFKPGLLGIVNSPGFGATNMWTYLNIYWELGTPGEMNVTEILPDEPDIFNPLSSYSYASWKFMDRVFDPLIAMNPYNHKDISWVATHCEVTETSIGMDVTYYLRNDTFWQDGYPYNASNAEFSLEFIRDWQIPSLKLVWQNIVDVEVIDENAFTVHANVTSQFLIYDWSAWAARLPPLVWDRPWSNLDEILRYDPSGPYSPAPGYDPGPTPPPTNLFGTGPFIFQFYLAPEYGELSANRNYFLTTEEIHDLKVEMFHEVGDVNRDGYIDIFDLSRIGRVFGSIQGEPDYDPDADLNHDGIIDMRDIACIAFFYGSQREYPVPTEDP